MAKKYEQITYLQALISKWPDYCKVIGFITAKDGTKYAIPAVKTLLLALENPRVMRFCMGEEKWNRRQEKIRQREAELEMNRYRKAHPGENSPEYKAWAAQVYEGSRKLLSRSIKTDTLECLKSELRHAKKRLYRYRTMGKVLEECREAERIRKLEEKIQVASNKSQVAR